MKKLLFIVMSLLVVIPLFVVAYETNTEWIVQLEDDNGDDVSLGLEVEYIEHDDGETELLYYIFHCENNGGGVYGVDEFVHNYLYGEDLEEDLERGYYLESSQITDQRENELWKFSDDITDSNSYFWCQAYHSSILEEELVEDGYERINIDIEDLLEEYDSIDYGIHNCEIFGCDCDYDGRVDTEINDDGIIAYERCVASTDNQFWEEGYSCESSPGTYYSYVYRGEEDSDNCATGIDKCADSEDNDGDGSTDYPSDNGCENRFDETERNANKNVNSNNANTYTVSTNTNTDTNTINTKNRFSSKSKAPEEESNFFVQFWNWLIGK